MSISPRSGARVLQRLPCLKYYNVPKWKNRFNWGLNAAKITDDIKKMLQTKIIILGNFGSIESSIESTFPFQYVKIF